MIEYLKNCPRCQTMKITYEFVANKSRKDGFGDCCKLCDAEMKRAQRHTKQEIREYWQYQRQHMINYALSLKDAPLEEYFNSEVE